MEAVFNRFNTGTAYGVKMIGNKWGPCENDFFSGITCYDVTPRAHSYLPLVKAG